MSLFFFQPMIEPSHLAGRGERRAPVLLMQSYHAVDAPEGGAMGGGTNPPGQKPIIPLSVGSTTAVVSCSHHWQTNCTRRIPRCTCRAFGQPQRPHFTPCTHTGS